MVDFFLDAKIPGKAEGCPQIGKGEIWRCFCIQNHRNTKSLMGTTENRFRHREKYLQNLQNTPPFFRGLPFFFCSFFFNSTSMAFSKNVSFCCTGNVQLGVRKAKVQANTFATELSTNNADERNEQCL